MYILWSVGTVSTCIFKNTCLYNNILKLTNIQERENPNKALHLKGVIDLFCKINTLHNTVTMTTARNANNTTTLHVYPNLSVSSVNILNLYEFFYFPSLFDDSALYLYLA